MEHFTMRLGAIDEVLKKGLTEQGGIIRGQFTFVKKGANYGIMAV